MKVDYFLNIRPRQQLAIGSSSPCYKSLSPGYMPVHSRTFSSYCLKIRFLLECKPLQILLFLSSSYWSVLLWICVVIQKSIVFFFAGLWKFNRSMGTENPWISSRWRWMWVLFFSNISIRCLKSLKVLHVWSFTNFEKFSLIDSSGPEHFGKQKFYEPTRRFKRNSQLKD